MRVVVQDKYYLRDLHREIDLLDRKLIHVSKYEAFETAELREAAVRKMVTKREALAETARSLAGAGIEFLPSELPRSFRPEGYVDDIPEKTSPRASADIIVSTTPRRSGTDPIPSHFGEQIARLQKEIDPSPLASWQNDLQAYKRRRQKLQTALPAVS